MISHAPILADVSSYRADASAADAGVVFGPPQGGWGPQTGPRQPFGRQMTLAGGLVAQVPPRTGGTPTTTPSAGMAASPFPYLVAPPNL